MDSLSSCLLKKQVIFYIAFYFSCNEIILNKVTILFFPEIDTFNSEKKDYQPIIVDLKSYFFLLQYG